MKWKLFKDEIHGLQAACGSVAGAWMLIRNECHNRQIEVPQLSKIKLIRILTDGEVEFLKANQKTTILK